MKLNFCTLESFSEMKRSFVIGQINEALFCIADSVQWQGVGWMTRV
jgi:hypothetical protein